MDVKQLMPPGRMVDLGGFRLHAIARGQGTPNVIFESGLGGCALQFGPLQSAVSSFTGTLAYDRAGQAWSDSSPNTRTPVNIAGELRELLSRLEVEPPYVWVGHSFGGLLVRIYAGLYPEVTAGVVLIDSSDVDQYSSFPSMDKAASQLAGSVRFLKFLLRLGLGKPLMKMSLGSAGKSMPKDELNAFLTVASLPRHNDTMLAEFSQHRFYFGGQAEVPVSLGDTPVLTVTAGNSVSGKAKFGNITADELNVRHQKWQRELVGISSQADHLILPGASHLSILLQPEYVAQVTDTIRRMVESVRPQVR
ncbi:MAG TPA: alpha/beta hydrolase [Anaerolineales bacterium]